MSKGYTISFFVNAVNAADAHELRTNLGYAISPRVGVWSTKYAALNNWLGGYAYDIAKGRNGFASAGNTPRRRLLNALKARKTGTFNSFVAKHRDLF